MSNYHRVQRFWNGLLKPVYLSDKVRFALQQVTVEYLSVIGLPFDTRLHDIKALNINFLPDRAELIEFQGDSYVVIGQEFFADLVFTLAIKSRSNEVFRLFKRNESPYDVEIEFINTTVQQFLEFIVEYIEWSTKVWDIFKRWPQIISGESGEEAKLRRKLLRTQMDENIHNMKREFEDIDKAALVDNSGYWNRKIADLYLL